MKLQNYKSYQQVHIWTGILSGILLFICFVTGALTMFKGPLNVWAMHEEHALPSIELADYDPLIQQVLRQHPEAAKSMTVYLPPAMPNHAPVTWTIEDPQTHSATVWQASLNEQGELLSNVTELSAIGEFLDHIHRTAGIPGGDDHDAVGIFVMGVVCVLYFVAIVSGLIIFLPTWMKDLFSLRRNKTGKRFWVDFHNVLGISALPFHIIIALTTVVFAYHDILYGGLQQFVYKDTPMFNRTAPVDIDRSVENLLPINAIEASIHQLEPDYEVAILSYSGLGTPRARVLVAGKQPGEIIRGPYSFWATNPYTAGHENSAMLPSQAGVPSKVVNGFFTLHFGGFGGTFMHWVYFFMGLSGSLLFLTGNIIWIESRRKKQLKSEQLQPQRKSIKVMARLTVGACAGTLVGVCTSLIAAKLASASQGNIALVQQWAYYLGFFAAVIYAFFVTPMRSAIHLLYVIAGLLLAMIVVTVVYASSSLSLGIDLGVGTVAAVCALLMVITARHLKAKMPQMTTDSVWC